MKGDVNDHDKHGTEEWDADNAGKPVTGEEYRQIIDLWLFGYGMRSIARKVGRTVDAVDTIIHSRIPSNYQRDLPLDRLRGKESTLLPSRDLDNRNRVYLVLLRSHKRTREECQMIMALSDEAMNRAWQTMTPKRQERLI